MALYCGDSWPAYNFDVLVDDLPATGFSVLMQVKKPGAATVFKTLSGGAGFFISGNNVAFNTLVDIGAGRYIYDIQITLSNGEVHTQYAGILTVKGDVSV